jgi:hypothetical protein
MVIWEKSIKVNMISSSFIVLLLVCNCSSYVIQHQLKQHHKSTDKQEKLVPLKLELLTPQGLKWKNQIPPLEPLEKSELIAKEKDFEKNFLLVFKLMDRNSNF